MNKKSNTKTLPLLVDTARKLFAKKGKNGVTMNDIAEASGKSRRTLYTYFTTKEEVYMAVIENELEILIDRQQQVVNTELEPDKKLEEYIFSHFEGIRNAINRNGALRNDIFRNIYEVEQARRSIDLKEIRLLRQILHEGAQQGVFRIQSIESAAMLLFYSIKGLEAPFINNNVGNYILSRRKQIMHTLINGMKPQKYGLD